RRGLQLQLLAGDQRQRLVGVGGVGDPVHVRIVRERRGGGQDVLPRLRERRRVEPVGGQVRGGEARERRGEDHAARHALERDRLVLHPARGVDLEQRAA